MGNRIFSLFVKLMIYFLIILITAKGSYFLFGQYAKPSGSSYNIYLYQFIEATLVILCGIVLRYERLVSLFKTNGRWNFDILRFLVLALPIIVISYQMPIYYSNFLPFRLLGDILYSLGIKDNLLIIFQLLAGSLLVSCIDKVDPTGSNVE